MPPSRAKLLKTKTISSARATTGVSRDRRVIMYNPLAQLEERHNFRCNIKTNHYAAVHALKVHH
jgi:hypothetical protein